MSSFRELLRYCMNNVSWKHLQQQIDDGSIYINLQDNHGETVLRVFCSWCNSDQKYVQTIEFLLHLGANPNISADDGRTP